MKKRVNTVLSLLVVSQYFKDFFKNKLVLLIFFGIADLFEIDSGQHHFNKRFNKRGEKPVSFAILNAT